MKMIKAFETIEKRKSEKETMEHLKQQIEKYMVIYI